MQLAQGRSAAGVALADDANAVFWNPAGLARQQGAEVTFTHAPWLPELGADLYFEYLAGKYAIPGVGVAAAHVTFLNLGEQQRVDEQGTELGTFRSYDLAYRCLHLLVERRSLPASAPQDYLAMLRRASR